MLPKSNIKVSHGEYQNQEFLKRFQLNTWKPRPMTIFFPKGDKLVLILYGGAVLQK